MGVVAGNGRLVIFVLGGLLALALLASLATFAILRAGASGPSPAPTSAEVAQGGNERIVALASGYIISMAFSPDGRRVAVGTAHQGAQVWSVEESNLQFATAPGEVKGVAYSPDGTLLAVGWSSEDGKQHQVQLLHAGDGKPVRVLPGDIPRVSSLAFSPDGKLLAVGTENDVRLCDVASGGCTHTLDTRGWQVLFSPDGKTLLTAGDGLKLWRVSDGTHIRDIEGWYGAAISPDGKTLASPAAEQGLHVQLWQVDSGSPGSKLEMRPAVPATGLVQVHGLAFSPDGKMVAASSNNGEAEVWDLNSGKSLYTFAYAASLDSGTIAFSPDSKRFAAQDAYGVHIWTLNR